MPMRCGLSRGSVRRRDSVPRPILEPVSSTDGLLFDRTLGVLKIAIGKIQSIPDNEESG